MGLRFKLYKIFSRIIAKFLGIELAPKSHSVDGGRLEQINQINLAMQYKLMLCNNMVLPAFDEVGFTAYSESDEDGILWYIFSLVGITDKRVLDIGASAILGSNTANLFINHGWTGLLIEGDSKKCRDLSEFYRNASATRNFPPKVVNAWMTRENINDLVTSHGIRGDIDLLSLDIDGIDYWLWEALDVVRPRVVVLEYQCIWGAEKAVTVPYSDNFRGEFVDRFGVYSGASLAAFVKLGREKGYRLVGCQRYGYNAFFVRNDVGVDVFPEIDPRECFKHPFAQWAQKELLPHVRDREWIEL